ncbi:MAG TPA: efflux RND transporter permease subunit, partial [Marivita sp.]|nr:efflux RND transporter permease subunit [Marivita sp.]
MNTIIDAAFSRTRVVIMALVMILSVGTFAYISIPKEANPEVPLPLVYVSTGLDGISPTDAERLLLEPMETEFGGIEDLQKMSSEATEGFARPYDRIRRQLDRRPLLRHSATRVVPVFGAEPQE